MTDHVRVEDADGVRTITLNRPDKKNALTHAMYAAMADAIAQADADPEIRVLAFRAEGSVYSAGNDLGDFMNTPPDTGAGEDARPPVARFLAALAAAETPVVAEVQGPAVGVGATMLLHCELVYASEAATLKFPFIDLGLVPEAGSSMLLPERIGRARAAELFFLGERVDAYEAQRLGLISRIFPAGDLAHEVRARAVALAGKPPGAVRQTKRLIAGDRDRLAARMLEEGQIFARLLGSEEFSEAATAFFEGRQPDFRRFA